MYKYIRRGGEDIIEQVGSQWFQSWWKQGGGDPMTHGNSNHGENRVGEIQWPMAIPIMWKAGGGHPLTHGNSNHGESMGEIHRLMAIIIMGKGVKYFQPTYPVTFINFVFQRQDGSDIWGLDEICQWFGTPTFIPSVLCLSSDDCSWRHMAKKHQTCQSEMGVYKVFFFRSSVNMLTKGKIIHVYWRSKLSWVVILKSTVLI